METNEIKEKKSKKSKKKIVIIAAAAVIAVVAVAGSAVWYFSSGTENGKTAGAAGAAEEVIDISADTTETLVPAEEVTTGGAVHETAESFPEELAGALMTVNGEPVDAGICQFTIDNKAIKYVEDLVRSGAITDAASFSWETKDPNFDGTYLEYVKNSALDELIQRYALLAEGKRRGITLSEDDKKQIQDWLAAEKGDKSDEEFEAYVKENGGVSVDTLRSYREFITLVDKVEADFNKNPEKYASREQLLKADERELATVKHIFVAFNPENVRGEATDEMKAAAKAKADEAFAKVNAGGDFDKLIAEYSDDAEMPAEGYTFTRDGSSFGETAFSLEIGQHSELIEGTYGYQIIKRLDRAVIIDDYYVLLSKNAQVKVNNSLFVPMAVTVDVVPYLEYIFSGNE